jgi:pimeloyl-ACP methyl ester carboxylesterase
VVVQGVGHLVNMEKPDEFNRAVLGFLKEQARQRRP